jgi:hypothetical protein
LEVEKNDLERKYHRSQDSEDTCLAPDNQKIKYRFLGWTKLRVFVASGKSEDGALRFGSKVANRRTAAIVCPYFLY